MGVQVIEMAVVVIGMQEIGVVLASVVVVVVVVSLSHGLIVVV